MSARDFADSIANEVQISHTMVLRYEGGIVPGADYVLAVCSVHRVNPGWLLTGHGIKEWAPEATGRRDQLAAASYMRQLADQLENDALRYGKPVGKVEPEDLGPPIREPNGDQKREAK